MNKEEIDIWLKHFADKQICYQIFDENGTRREINFFIVFIYLKGLQQKVNQLEEENRKLINNKYDTIYLIQDLACYDRETNSYCNGIKYYDVHKIIEELEGGSNE